MHGPTKAAVHAAVRRPRRVANSCQPAAKQRAPHHLHRPNPNLPARRSSTISAHDGMVPAFELSMQLKKKQQNWKDAKEKSKSVSASAGGAGDGGGGGAGGGGGGGGGRDKDQRRALADRDWVVKNVLKYLESTPAAEQNPDDAHKLLARLKEMEEKDPSMELMPAEKLQLLDMRPSSPAGGLGIAAVLACTSLTTAREQTQPLAP